MVAPPGYDPRVQQLFTLQRATHASPVALALLIGVNAIPLIGVLFLGWDLATIVAAYWLENGVVGLFAIGRIATAGGSVMPPPRPGDPPEPPAAAQVRRLLGGSAMKLVMVPFFCVHYGMFWFVHGVFVWTALPLLFSSTGAAGGGPDIGIVLGLGVPMLLSHGASFVFNWLGGGEYRTSNPSAEMFAPYGRVVILHMTIIFGAFGVAILGAPVWAMVVMVTLKTGIDVAAHLAERKRAAGRMTLAA